MEPTELTRDLETLWIWIAAPLALLTAIVLTVRLRVPQVMKLPEAFRALYAFDPKAAGSLHPATSAALAAVAEYGAAGAVGAATAVSLGGAGAIAWVWLFAIVFAPLRMAEALLARTAPPGKAGARTGSLAAHVLAVEGVPMKVIGWALVVLVPLAGFAFFGGTHGEAVVDAAGRLLPGSAMTLGLVVAGVGGLLAVLPTKRVGSILGWIGAVSLIAIFGAALVAIFSEPGRAFGGVGRAVMDAVYDAPSLRAFSGATVGEIAFAAMLHLLPPLAGTGGMEGALHAEARSTTTKRQAAVALLGPMAFGLLTTLLGLSLVATGAFARPAEDSRTITEVTAYRVAFDTVSQRHEEDRIFRGLLRVNDGSTGVVQTALATERGMIRTPRFTDRGEPADILLRFDGGRALELQRKSDRSLEAQPISDLADIEVHGEMLPRGGLLLAQSMTRGGGSIVARVALAALLLLAVIGAAAWGIGVARTLRVAVPEKIARYGAILPALGVALAALGVVPGFGTIGLVVAALLSIISSLALLARSKQAGQLSR